MDGSGKPGFLGDVLIRDDRILDVGRFPEAEAEREIDASNLAVAPGFVDVHCHLDFALSSKRHPEILEKWVRQGVTSVIAGNCGFSPAPANPPTDFFLKTYWSNAFPQKEKKTTWPTMAGFLDTLAQNGLVVNAGLFVGHNVIRHNSMGCHARFADEQDLRAMKKDLEESLTAGALGLSVGLLYIPGTYSHTKEIKSLARVLSGGGKVLAAHTRGLTQTYDKAVGEMIEAAEGAGIPLQLSHHAGGLSWPSKILSVYGWQTRLALGLLRSLGPGVFRRLVSSGNFVRKKAVRAVERARENGALIGCDNMPWMCGPTSVQALLPPWLFDGGVEMGLARLADSGIYGRAVYEMKTVTPKWPNWDNGWWTDNFASHSARVSGFRMANNLALEGRSVKEIGAIKGKDPFSALLDVTVEEGGGLFIIDGLFDHPAGDDLCALFLSDPECSIMTDVVGADYETSNPVPYGAFAKVLGEFARERKLWSQEEAVRKMTSLPARQMGIRDRGMIQKGLCADICVFNPTTAAHQSTFADPGHFATGVEYVFVNGAPVLDQGEYMVHSRSGRVL